MHSLAISLVKSGYQITGSDDKIYDPSLTTLQKYDPTYGLQIGLILHRRLNRDVALIINNYLMWFNDIRNNIYELYKLGNFNSKPLIYKIDYNLNIFSLHK